MTSKSGDFTIVDFTIPTRDTPVVHPCAEAPVCADCRSADLCFFDPTCSSCQTVLSNPKTTISELFAIMRQWIPQTQQHLNLLTREVLRRGAHINDRDGLTDLSLLHFAAKAGAAGIGNGSTAASLVNSLIMKGANTDLKCHWTDMNALHYAVYFDCVDVVDLLCQYNPALINTTCSEFDGGNSLHIAASNLSLSSAKILLNNYSAIVSRNSANLLPHECVPEVTAKSQVSAAQELKMLLHEAFNSQSTTVGSTLINKTVSIAEQVDHKPLNTSRQDSSGSQQSSGPSPANSPALAAHSPASSLLTSTVASNSPDELNLVTLGLKLGDKVVVDASSAKSKKGTLRFAGETMFAAGQWAGVELDDECGRNDGSHGGIRYFSCKPKRGLFVSLKRVSKLGGASVDGAITKKKMPVSEARTKTDSSLVTAKAIEAHSQLHISSGLQVGDRVLVSGKDRGIIKFAGAVKFAPGFWLGVELDNARGNCDGSKGGKQYFKCKPSYGVFVLPSKLTKIHGKDSTDIPNSCGSSSPSPNPPHSTPPLKKKKPEPTQTTKSHSSYVSPVPTSLSLATAPEITLEKGMSVFVNKEKGTVQYIGHTDFAPGMWLGVELRKPSGKNDGSVNGKRYFTCKPNFGIFIKPEKATHRGINCSKLLKMNK